MPIQIRDREGNPLSVRELRERLNLTPAELAIKLGVAERTINRWEAGQTRIHQAAQRQLNRLARRSKKGGK